MCKFRSRFFLMKISSKKKGVRNGEQTRTLPLGLTWYTHFSWLHLQVNTTLNVQRFLFALVHVKRMQKCDSQPKKNGFTKRNDKCENEKSKCIVKTAEEKTRNKTTYFKWKHNEVVHVELWLSYSIFFTRLFFFKKKKTSQKRCEKVG